MDEKMEKTIFNGISELQRLGMRLDPAVSTEAYFRNPETQQIAKLERYKAIFNRDTKEVASVVSKDYTLVEHRPVVEAFTNELKKFNSNCFGTVYDYGDSMTVEAAFGDRDVIDGVKIGVRLTNSYNKYSSVKLQAFGYRTACDNGMFLGKALKSELTVKQNHIGDIDVNSLVSEFLAKLVDVEDSLKNYISLAMSQTIELDQIELLLDGIGKKYKDKIMFALLYSNTELTKWKLYNALTWVATHVAVGKYGIDKLQNKAQEILVTVQP